MAKRCEQIGNATLYLADCREMEIKGEVLITDPVWPNVNKEMVKYGVSQKTIYGVRRRIARLAQVSS